MKTVYTITRYKNGWAVDTNTGDLMKDFSAVYEDPYWQEDDTARQESLIALLSNTFIELDDIEFEIEEEEKEEEESESESESEEGEE